MKISKGSIFVIVFYTTIICVAVYTSCGTESENKKSKTEKLDSLRPYDRVFSTIKTQMMITQMMITQMMITWIEIVIHLTLTTLFKLLLGIVLLSIIKVML